MSEESLMLGVSPIPRNIGIPEEEIDDVVRITPVLLIKDGVPMTFYVAPCAKEGKREEIQELILSAGGEVSKTCQPGVITLVDPDKSDISAKTQYDCYALDFIADCILKDKLLDLEDYLIVPETKKQRRENRKRYKYTESDDLKLALYVAAHSNQSQSSIKLWKQAEEDRITIGHPWQSMRSRFLKTVQPRLVERAKSKREAAGQSFPEDLIPNSQDSSLDGDNSYWNILTTSEIEEIFGGREEFFIPPSVLMADGPSATFADPKYTVNSVLTYMKMVSGQPQSVVVHALIVNSGVVKDALEYLKNPRAFCATRNKENQVWTHREDKILLEKENAAVAALEAERGTEAIKKRLTFLES